MFTAEMPDAGVALATFAPMARHAASATTLVASHLRIETSSSQYRRTRHSCARLRDVQEGFQSFTAECLRAYRRTTSAGSRSGTWPVQNEQEHGMGSISARLRSSA